MPEFERVRALLEIANTDLRLHLAPADLDALAERLSEASTLVDAYARPAWESLCICGCALPEPVEDAYNIFQTCNRCKGLLPGKNASPRDQRD